MSNDNQTAFEAGFLGVSGGLLERTGEYQLGDSLGEALAGKTQPALLQPDELTVRRRMVAAQKGESSRRVTSWAPFATAAALLLSIGVLLVQIQRDPHNCGLLNDGRAVSFCSEQFAAVSALVQERYPGEQLYQELAQRPTVNAPYETVSQVLSEAEAEYMIFDLPDKYASQGGNSAHGLVLATSSEQEFRNIRRVMAVNRTTFELAAELSRILNDEAPQWPDDRPLLNVISLVSLN